MSVNNPGLWALPPLRQLEESGKWKKPRPSFIVKVSCRLKEDENGGASVHLHEPTAEFHQTRAKLIRLQGTWFTYESDWGGDTAGTVTCSKCGAMLDLTHRDIQDRIKFLTARGAKRVWIAQMWGVFNTPKSVNYKVRGEILPVGINLLREEELPPVWVQEQYPWVDFRDNGPAWEYKGESRGGEYAPSEDDLPPYDEPPF